MISQGGMWAGMCGREGIARGGGAAALGAWGVPWEANRGTETAETMVVRAVRMSSVEAVDRMRRW